MGLILVILVIGISTIFTFSAFAQTQETISVTTSKNSYKEGDTIVISGQVSSIELDTPVTLQIFLEGNLVDIAGITVAQDGKFTHTMLAKGPLWQKDGTYIVRASYGANYMVETSFEFFSKSPSPETTNIFEVDAGSYGTFDVHYTIGGATVKNMIVDPEIFALVMIIESDGDGSMTLDLPRYGIDAKKSDGTDDSFIILIDGVEVPYKEISTNSNSRTITIVFEQGDSDIKIHGTVIAGSSTPTHQSTKKVPDFIDPKKGAQYYLDRYYNEPAYKKWFDTNFPGYTIEEAIAIAISGSNSGSVSSIKVTTDSSSYKKGDIIVISGQVENPQDYEVILRITNPGDTPVYQQNLGLNEGAFGDMVIAGNSIQWTDGTYIVKATHNDASTTTSFSFSDSNITPSPSPSTARVSVAQGSSVPGCEETNQCYIPFEARVAVDGEVTWNNDDTAAHTVTSGTAADGPDGNFDSSLFMAGSSFSNRFDESGTFPYFCMVHPWMIGVVVVGQGGTSPPPPTPSPNISISVDSDRSLYDLGDIVNLSIKLSGTSKSQNVAVSVADPTGHAVVSRTLVTDSSGMANTEFGINENFKTGTYSVATTVSIGGVTYKDTTNFKVQSQFNQIKIISVEGTDQQGNPAPFTRGELGFVKVVISANKPITTLATVNLFDSQLTTIGIASFRTTLSTGESEMILSFFIPEDTVVGSANIYANAFSDWPSNGGVSLTGEYSAQVRIR